MDCFNHSCPFRVNETSNANRCDCIACQNRSNSDFIITSNRTLTGDELAILTALYKANNIYSAIDNIPTADVSPVRHGRWEWFEEWSYSTPEHSSECDDCGWRCSECKTKLEDMVNGYYDDSYEVPQLNYCPNCGAKMDGE